MRLDRDYSHQAKMGVHRIVLALCLALGFIQSAFGFGVLGHQTVAALAQSMLSAKTRTGVAAILGSQTNLPKLSTWSDDIRYLRPDTRPWHFITIQIGEDHYDPAKTNTPNVITAYRWAWQTLSQGNADGYAREEALKWLVHLAGDMHQPLHTGEDKDKGGNLVKVKLGRRTHNLHAVWDQVLLERLHLDADSLCLLLAREITADTGFIHRNARGKVEDWVNETHRKSRICYSIHGKSMRKGIVTSLDSEYIHTNTLVVLEQLKIAGVRLAYALNAIFDPGNHVWPSLLLRPLPWVGWHPDPEVYFNHADREPGKQSQMSDKNRFTKEFGSGFSSSVGGEYVWSVHSEIYHYRGCAAIAKIKRKNLRSAKSPPSRRTLHNGCPKRR